MLIMNRVWGMLATVAVVLLIGTSAEAQLTKSGTFSLYYSWQGRGVNVNFDKDGSFLGGGLVHGVLINKTGEGFLHNAPTDCGVGFKNFHGAAEDTGYCVSTDADGDRVVMRWVCSWNKEGWCAGEFDWTDGSGKYQGISGKNTLKYKAFGFRAGANTTHGTPTEVDGYSVWEGGWRLP